MVRVGSVRYVDGSPFGPECYEESAKYALAASLAAKSDKRDDESEDEYSGRIAGHMEALQVIDGFKISEKTG
jgi:hypothetical protein